MYVSDVLGWGGLLPAILAAALFLARGGTAPGVAVAIAFLLTRAWTLGSPRLVPVEAVDYVAPLVLVGAVLGVLAPRRRWVDVLGGLLVVVCAVQVLWPRVQFGWAGAEAVWRPVLAVSFALTAWLWTRRLVAPVRGVAPGLAILVALLAVALAATGSIVLAQHAGLLAAATGGVALAALVRGGELPAELLLPSVVLPMLALIGAGVFYSELPVWAGATFLACLGGLVAADGDRSGFPWRGLIAVALPAAALTGTLLWVAWSETAGAGQPY